MIEYAHYLYNSTVLLVLLGIFLLYKFYTTQYDLHLKLGRKGPPPLPFLGNLYGLYKYGFHELDKKHLKKYGKLYPFYLGNVKLIMVLDEELLKQILIKETKSFTDRMDVGANGEMVSKMLSDLKGKDWERIRYLVSPTFTSGKLKKMSPMVYDCIELFEKVLDAHPADKPVDVKEVFGSLILDVMARTMFGMNIDCQTNPNNHFITHAKKLFNIPVFHPLFLFLLLFPKLGPIFRALFPKYEIFGPDTLEFFNSNLNKVINEREKIPEQYHDFLELMLNVHNGTDEKVPNQSENVHSKYLTNQEIIAQCVIFLLAGYETTASTLTFAAYFLARNRAAQQEVYDELLEKIGIEGKLTYESLTNMPVMDAAIAETLRLCPPIIRIDRTCTQDSVLITSDKRKIKARKGDIFSIPIYAIHTDPSVWTDPDKFDIRRFNPENKKTNSQCSYMPFGLGPRNCVGMRFAFLQLRLALANFLIKFEVVPCKETVETLRFENTGFSTPAETIFLKIIKR